MMAAQRIILSKPMENLNMDLLYEGVDLYLKTKIEIQTRP